MNKKSAYLNNNLFSVVWKSPKFGENWGWVDNNTISYFICLTRWGQPNVDIWMFGFRQKQILRHFVCLLWMLHSKFTWFRNPRGHVPSVEMAMALLLWISDYFAWMYMSSKCAHFQFAQGLLNSLVESFSGILYTSSKTWICVINILIPFICNGFLKTIHKVWVSISISQFSPIELFFYTSFKSCRHNSFQ